MFKFNSQENGILPEFQLAPEGVNQAQLAGYSFQKVSINFNKQFEFEFEFEYIHYLDRN